MGEFRFVCLFCKTIGSNPVDHPTDCIDNLQYHNSKINNSNIHAFQLMLSQVCARQVLSLQSNQMSWQCDTPRQLYSAHTNSSTHDHAESDIMFLVERRPRLPKVVSTMLLTAAVPSHWVGVHCVEFAIILIRFASGDCNVSSCSFMQKQV